MSDLDAKKICNRGCNHGCPMADTKMVYPACFRALCEKLKEEKDAKN